MQFIDLKKQYSLMEPEILARIKKVLDSGQYIMGPEIPELEDQLADYIGVKHAILNSSGTDALLMALMALGVGPGDEVVTSSFSFFATAEVILLCGAKPVFVDIDPKTYNLDPHLLEEAMTSKTKAIMPVSMYGQCAELREINQIAEKYEIPVIEDGAQSFGAKHHGRFSCALTTIGCTSFFPSKPLGAYGDAGACFTDDDNLAQILREIRIHGQSARYVHTRVGLNGRIDTIQAAILLEKFRHFSLEITLRQEVVQRYGQLLQGRVQTPEVAVYNQSVFAQYTIEVEERERVQQYLQSKGIPTAVHYPIAMHEQKALKELGYKKGDFPQSERVSERVLSLPMHPYLTEIDQKRIQESLFEAIECEVDSVS